MEPNSSPATNDPATPVVDDKPNYDSPNDLGYEMTAEEEQAFVNEQLGVVSDTVDDQPTEPKGTPGSGQPVEPTGEPTAPVEEPAEPPKVETPAPKVEAPEAPETPKPETPEVTDGTDIKTDDLWVEVDKVVENDDGTFTTEKVKLVYDPANPSSFVPDDFKFKSDKQITDILEAKQEMASLYKERQADFTKQQEEKAIQDKETAQIASWNAEVQELFDSGVLTPPKITDVNDPNYTKDDAIQKVDAIFKFMAEQNDLRAKEGKLPIQSFGTAYTLYSKQEADTAAVDAQKLETDLAKKKAAMIGGSSAASGNSTSYYNPGSHSTIWDVPVIEE